MKKCFFYLFFVLSLTALSGYSIKMFAQDEETDDEEYIEEEEDVDLAPLKMIFFDLGYGPNGVGGALGFRYWHFGASFGLTGISKDVPNYVLYPTPQQPKPSNFTEEKFTALIVTGDIYYFHDFNRKFTAYANVGYFGQADTVLHKDNITGYYYYERKESLSGITFGGGLQYVLSQWIAVGLGYHSKLGITARIGYKWN